ncbi:hypothetical protein [Mucilaginibacter kameinonensis]|uniref:hypothetical protein n=1 Tax=Mucilaginibacter kameinonensis TaxID=452286 RepID=UPI000EF7CC4C|nr:hypothetical protein [Mucilaginibacter kameinonensis]
MAGSKLRTGLRIQGSTLLEVIISMIIIIVVFGIAMMIFTNVSRSSLSVQKLSAQAILQETLLAAEQTGGQTDEKISIEDLTITQEIKPLENQPGLSVVTLTAFNPNHEQIAQLKKVIVAYEK